MGQPFTAKEQRRIREFVALVPADARWVLDAGCGDGRVSRALGAEGIKVVGLDIDAEPLRQCEGMRVRGTIWRLPFAADSVDAVVCTEVIEHLSDAEREQAVREFRRVSRRYLVVSVPWEENLASRTAACSTCGVKSHVWGHLSRFSRQRLLACLPGWRLLRITNIGPREVPSFEAGRIGDLLFRLVGSGATDVDWRCPHCGALNLKQETNRRLRQPWKLVLAALRHLWPIRRPFWLAAVFEKTAGRPC